MTEEQITRKTLLWLDANGFKILDFDYPGSGTGKPLHPNAELRAEANKNKGCIIPDIVASLDDEFYIFENKVNFYAPDIESLVSLTRNGEYDDTLLINYGIKNPEKTKIGIALKNTKSNVRRISEHLRLLDFYILVGPLSIESIHGIDLSST